MNTHLHLQRARRGFSLIEVLILVVVMSIISVAAASALQSMIKSPAQTDQYYQIEMQMISKMESIRAMGFDQIALGSPNATLTDGVTINNTSYQRTVTVAGADPGNGDSSGTNFKMVTVTCDNQSISAYISR